MKLLRNKKEGISLVALIVTIIVLIILTGAVIVTFMEGGIVDRAKQAVRKSDLSTLKEAFMIEYNKAKIDADTKFGEEVDKIAILEITVKDVKLEKDFTFEKYGNIRGVTYTGDNEDIAQWVAELVIESTEGYILANGYLTNLEDETTVSQIKAQLGDDIIVKKYSGETLGDGDNVGTGATIEKENVGKIATVVLFGDCDGNTMSLTDALSIVSVLSGSNSNKQLVLLAGDVNNDGYVSGEDSDCITSWLAGKYTINQKRVIYKLPTIYSKLVYEEDEEDGEIYSYYDMYLYKWYKNGKDITEVINENGVYVATSNANGTLVNLTIPSGTTYLQIENVLKESISGEIQITDIQNKNATPELNEIFYISIPEIIDENTRSAITSLRFKIKAIN